MDVNLLVSLFEFSYYPCTQHLQSSPLHLVLLVLYSEGSSA